MSAPESEHLGPEALPTSSASGERDIFFAAVEKTRMPMIVTDPRKPDNPIVFANPAFLQMTGYTTQEVVGHNCSFLQGPETDPAAIAEMRRAIGERRDVALEILNYRKDGSTFWNALFVSPVYDAGGELLYFFGSQLDVSRRRDAEEALGQLAGGAAHDAGRMLQLMAGYLQMMDLGLTTPNPDPARTRKSVDSLCSAVTRASVLAQRRPATARRHKLYERTVNLNSVAESLADLMRRTLCGGIALQCHLAPDLWNCQVDPTQMEVALLNVLLNARNAMPGGGTLTLRTSNEVISAEDLEAHPGLHAGRHVSIAVTDTGAGIAPELLNRKMEPFFAIREGSTSAGLGLPMVHGFARQAGGTVHIQSRPGAGTTVRLYFPVRERAVRDGWTA